MADAVFTIKAVADVSDVVSNVGAIQKAFAKLKLPDNLKDSLTKNISSFYKEYEKYQKKLSDGIKTQGDFNQVEKSLNRLKSLYADIGKDAAKAVKIDPAALFDLDEGKFKGIVDKIENTLKQLSDIKIDTKAFTDPIEEIAKLTKNQKIVGEGGILNRMMGHLETGNITEAKKEYESLMQTMQKAAPKFDEFGNKLNKPGTFSVAHYEQLKVALDKLGTALLTAGKDTKPLEEELNRLQAELAETISLSSKDLIGNVGDYNKQVQGVEKVTDSLKRMHEEEYSFNRQAQDIDRQIQSYFGLSQMIRKVADIARDAFQTVKELDAAMVETAVVTNFDVGDMWNMLPTYTANANQLGATIKDVYEAATLYFQQGLNLSQSMGLANETLKMARIGGLQAAEATNMMTAALRGFNMEINQLSAKRINDVYSELAAITAADTKEIGSAMERTASIANSANMEFETTSAFLAQMIETTREAPENLGTAMKTIIARFQEMKQDPTKLVDSEGVALDANKIDTALKTIGVDLKNQKGEFRDLDDVFLDISERWNSLTQGQQRYIATIAAGSRQQSRFIAMMQNYERVKELVDAANNSAGAGQKQFEKTLEGLSAKLNKLKNAWDQFTMGLMNNQLIKVGVDALTGFFTVVNKIFDLFTKKIPDPFGGLVKSALTLVSTLGLLNIGKKGARGLVMGGVGWWSGEGFAKNFASGWGGAAAKAGTADGRVYAENFNKAIKAGKLGDAFAQTKQYAQQLSQKQNEKVYENTFDAAFGQFDAKTLSRAMQTNSALEDSIRTSFARATQNVDLAPYGIDDAEEYLNGLINRLKAGESSAAQEIQALALATNGEVDLGKAGVGEEIEKITKETKPLGEGLRNAGSSMQMFGMALQQTPLAPFGSMLSMIGGLLSGFGGIIGKVATIWVTGITTATGTTLTGVAAMKAGFSALFATIWEFFTTNPVGWVLLAIAGVVAAVKGIDAIYESQAEKMEAATDAAAAASEAFDLAKQETSELTDAISRIQEADNAFDNLVAGTAEFNEQLVTANQQITELAQKYPMLNDYITIDKNGLMHVSEEGLKAVKEYQKQIQARASATNIIQAADLAALENQQKADKLRKEADKISTSAEKRKKNFEDADLLEQRAKAETESARLNAIRTALQGKEINNVEAISAAYANLYEEKRKAAEVEVNAMDKHERRAAYADYHGYTYNKSSGKMHDTEGNEVDFDDKVLKDEVIENTVLLNFEANADTLDNVLTNVDARFSEAIGNAYKNSDSFVSDLLSSNIETNTDLLRDVLSGQSSDLQDAIHSLDEAEIAAILGISESDVEGNLKEYQDKTIDLLTERANSILEAQSQTYADLGQMIAQTSNVDITTANTKKFQDSITQQVNKLSAEHANTLVNIGKILETNVGTEAMGTFIDKAYNIYASNSEDLIKDFNSIIENVNWESPTSRLEAYNEAMDSSRGRIQEWGKSMRASADEANILGEAFTEFLNKDWEELSKNADNFKNSLGEIDNAGIMAAAKESKTLKSLLDSGEVSATGLAKALQAVEDGSLSEVNSTVLELLSSFNRLGDAALAAHDVISNFDAGIDYGEGEDFVKENAEKAKEYYNNGEWGNQQLQNYIKLAAGTDKWNETLRANSGNLQKTTDDLMKYVTTFSDGFQPAWDQMISGKNINGKNLSDAIKDAVDNVDTTGVSKELGKKFEDVKVYWDDEGFMQIDVGELTTSELETYFQEIYGVSKEYAQLLMQDLANYDGEVSAALAKNDLQATVGNKDFQNRHLDREGNLTFSNADLQAFEQAGGSIKELEQAAGKAVNTFNVVDEEGNRLKNATKLLQEYDKTFGTGVGKIDSLIQDSSLLRDGKLDLSQLVSDVQTRAGFDTQQAMDAAFKAYERASRAGETTTYEGIELEKGLDRKGWEEAIAAAQDTSKWVPIGEAIAQGFMNAYNKDNLKDADASSKTDLKVGADASAAKKEIDSVKNHYSETLNSINNRPAILKAEDKNATEKTTHVMSSWQEVVDSGANNPLVVQADTTKADKDIEAVSSHYGQLQDKTSQPLSIGSVQKAEPKTSEKSKSKSSTYEVDVKGQDKVTELQTKVKELSDTVNKGGTYNLKVSGAGTIQKAAKAAKDLSGSKETKTISVKTGKADTSSIAAAKASISSTKTNIKVGADVSQALSKVNSLVSKIKNQSPRLKVNVSPNFTGTWTKTVTIKKGGDGGGGAKGINNYIPYHSMPQLGSLAKGRRYGRLGPKGKGGLTLTGEKGYEIAWIPSESRSMILGAEGPQMINLPSDAVVYTHEQSKDILKKKQTIEAGSQAKTGRRKKSGSSGKSKGKKKKGKKNKKSKDKSKGTINNFSMEEVVRFNIDPKLTALTDAIEKRTKDIEKSLTKIGNTYDNIVKSAKDQITALKGVQDYNQKLYNSYKNQLAELRKQKGSVSWTDDKGKSHDKTINISSYLNADGSVNQAAIAKLSTRAEREATFNFISGLAKPLTDGMESAKKAIQDAQNQIDELGQKISEAFYQWENELTEVYDLTQRINDEVSLTDRFTSQVELELAKLNAGFGDTAESIGNVRKVLIRNNDVIQKQIENQQQMIAARQRELQAAYSTQDELDKLNKYKNDTTMDSATKAATVEWAQELLKGAELGKKYVKNIFKDIDGHIEYEIDWAGFNADNDQSPYNKSTYDAIKKYLDDLNNAATEFNKSIQDQTDFIKQTYDALKEYQDKIVDVEDTLIKGVEEEIENETANTKKISDSIRDSLKDLLDEVKRKLDERRQQEDNAKTERDIAQKQQRLAALRADTAGGHQVEIAQLEKEIAEAQQSYERTLEDQLLNRLEQQADEAAQQRERQIELAETANDLNSSTNKELVDLWLKNPEAYKEEIKNAWLEANDYAEKGEAGQYVLQQEFESLFTELVTAVEQSGFNSSEQIFTALEGNTNTLVSLLTRLVEDQVGRDDELAKEFNAQTDATLRNTESLEALTINSTSAALAKANNVDATTLKDLGYSAENLVQGGYTAQELKNAGFTASEAIRGGINTPEQLKAGGYTAAEVKDAGITDIVDLLKAYTLAELKAGGFNPNDFKAGGVSYADVRTLYKAEDLTGSYTTEANAEIQAAAAKAAADAAAKKAAADKTAADKAAAAAWKKPHPYGYIDSYSGSIKKGAKGNKVKAIQNALNALGFKGKNGKKLSVDGDFGTNTDYAVKAFQKKYGLSKDGVVGPKTKAKFKSLGYKTGGLADYTGPAWLDGTPSKPELVLNAKDTKNFIALKDILSSAMNSTGATTTSYGDATFEININVDHINSDYDVDQIADRVKKDIIKSAGYRNVTQVRAFR